MHALVLATSLEYMNEPELKTTLFLTLLWKTSVSPMNCPTVHAAMEKDEEEYDPERIPPSVFARSDTLTPAEWSFVSNESLFSLHGGHTSMSREHDMLLNNERVRRLTELSKSGELSPRALRELRKLGGISKSSEFFKANSPISPTKPKAEEESAPTNCKPKIEEESETQVLANLEEKEVATNGMEKQTPKIMGHEKDEEKGLLQYSSTSTSRKSDGSVRSNMSFAFPV